jgi:hypothetical protein
MERTLRLAPNCHAFAGPGDSVLVYTAAEEFIKIELAPQQSSALLDLLHGRHTPRSVQAVIDEPELAEILDALAAEGIFAEEAGRLPALSRQRVEVRGANPIGEAVAGLLRAAEVGEVRLVADAPLHGEADLIVACAGWLPDREWQALDAWCRDRRIPWHRCHAEGSRWYLGPLTVWGQTAGYADVRDRFLAASAYPEEMLAYRRYLAAGGAVPEVAWPGPAAVAMLAGAMVQDALAYLRNEPIPTLGCQLSFAPAGLSWERHPVLPVPRDLLAAEADGVTDVVVEAAT